MRLQSVHRRKPVRVSTGSYLRRPPLSPRARRAARRAGKLGSQRPLRRPAGAQARRAWGGQNSTPKTTEKTQPTSITDLLLQGRTRIVASFTEKKKTNKTTRTPFAGVLVRLLTSSLRLLLAGRRWAPTRIRCDSLLVPGGDNTAGLPRIRALTGIFELQKL